MNQNQLPGFVEYKEEEADRKLQKERDIVDRVVNRIIEIDGGSSYYPCQHGSELPFLIVCDWNGKKVSRLVDFLEDYEHIINVGAYDEYDSCADCGCVVKTSPSYYGWSPDFIRDRGGMIVCTTCFEDNPEEFLDYYIDNPETAFFQSKVGNILEERGFKCLEDDKMACSRFETGFHPGQTDSPHEVIKDLRENLPNHDCIFVITDSGQFDTTWTVFIRPKNEG